MNEFKGTPGPWRAEHEVFKNGDCYRLRGNREEHLGDLYGAHREGEEAEYEANAKLIAAAPDLLEALKAARDLWGDYLPPGNSNAMKAMKLVNAAISKATSISN